ncbi:nucleotidyltransferase family protein [Dyadobacter aurulentus]|uniref:nucleotidyltransferase family protein n=1 Tax=Dyadobacter sp. UC 10 TaxID=2605428 RepID=UPI0011F3D843|nr:nucleotidyltransferase family protein [Dyadobacter sp. UC 10]KAA0989305.1 nucleotidyltransferase family protein [Dyadobacter sp. UC 10]
METRQSSIGIIILAAGNSSRLGEPKQLLLFQHKTLLRHIAEIAVEIADQKVIVVTGSSAALIENEVSKLPCQTVFNGHWLDGMASSIVKGITALNESYPDISGCIIAVSDQPFVTAEIFQNLIAEANTGTAIAASSYGDTLGTPVFFSKSYFDQLLQLKGSEGAKKLILAHQSNVRTVPFPLGTVDIDTQEDYKNLLKDS